MEPWVLCKSESQSLNTIDLTGLIVCHFRNMASKRIKEVGFVCDKCMKIGSMLHADLNNGNQTSHGKSASEVFHNFITKQKMCNNRVVYTTVPNLVCIPWSGAGMPSAEGAGGVGQSDMELWAGAQPRHVGA